MMVYLLYCVYVQSCVHMSLHSRAIKNGKGVHSKKEPVPHRVAELSGVRALSIYMYVTGSGKTDHIVKNVH